MLKQETLEINGHILIKTYSDDGHYVERDGIQYGEAIDPEKFITSGERVYTESEELIPVEDEEKEVVDE